MTDFAWLSYEEAIAMTAIQRAAVLREVDSQIQRLSGTRIMLEGMQAKAARATEREKE